VTDEPIPDPQIVLVVDDDESVRRGLKRLLVTAGYAVETFASAAELLAREPLTIPGCLIIDVQLPGLSGLELHDLLRSTGMEKATIFISGREDVPSSIRAMKSGAIDFLTKPIDSQELFGAVERALAVDRRVRSDDAELSELRRRAARLTPRERQVCALVASGRLNKQIAAVLGTSAKTVKVHRARVMAKLEVSSLPELVRIADRLGLRYRAGESAKGSGQLTSDSRATPP
jgi:FixJ family two-component response regulator